MVARNLFNNAVSFVDHFPLVGVGAADEPRSSHAHDIWRAQGVCLVPTTHHPPYMDWMRGRLYAATKSTVKLLHIRELGKWEGILPLSNGNDAMQQVTGVVSQTPSPPSALQLTHATHVDIIAVARRLGLDMCVCFRIMFML